LRSGGIHFPSSDEFLDDASLRRIMENSPEPNR